MNTQRFLCLTISKNSNSVVRTTLRTRHHQWNQIEQGRVCGPTSVPVALTGQRLRHSWPHLLGRQRSSTTTAIRLDLPDILLLVTEHNLCSCAGFAGLTAYQSDGRRKMAAGRWGDVVAWDSIGNPSYQTRP